MRTIVVDTERGPALADADDPAVVPVVVDAERPRLLHKRDLLIKALGWERGVRTVVDATAGLGRDAISLARFGFSVVAIERNDALARLWQAALQRTAVERLRFLHGDAAELLTGGVARGGGRIDVVIDAVLIDPMYPAGERSAKQGKESLLLRGLVGDVHDDAALVAAACAAAPRVVAKRPRRAPALFQVAHSFVGTSTRFDLWLRPRGPAG